MKTKTYIYNNYINIYDNQTGKSTIHISPNNSHSFTHLYNLNLTI